ncbi:MAG: terminase small subunit [Pseudomonadota bacterium]
MPKSAKSRGVILSKVDLANYFGVTRPTVDDWVRSGCPVVQKGNKRTPWKFNSADVYAWRLRQAEQASDDVKGMTFAELQKEKLLVEVERLKFQAAREKGETIDLKLTEDFTMKLMLDMKARMLRFPGEIAPKLDMADSRSDKKGILEAAIREIFEEIDREGEDILAKMLS